MTKFFNGFKSDKYVGLQGEIHKADSTGNIYIIEATDANGAKYAAHAWNKGEEIAFIPSNLYGCVASNQDINDELTTIMGEYFSNHDGE